MDRLWIGLILVGVFIIGLIYIILLLKEVTGKIDFLHEYREKFIKMANKFINSGYAKTLDPSLYQWLTFNVAKAQRMVGTFGVGEYMAAYQRYKVRNYQFIINTLPKFREKFLDHSEITNIDDILMRTIGFYEEISTDIKKELKNPFKWLQYGIRFLISFPVRILKWFGIIPEGWFDLITSNWFFKIISGLITLIGLFSAVVSLITGWEAFLEIVKKWI